MMWARAGAALMVVAILLVLQERSSIEGELQALKCLEHQARVQNYDLAAYLRGPLTPYEKRLKAASVDHLQRWCP